MLQAYGIEGHSNYKRLSNGAIVKDLLDGRLLDEDTLETYEAVYEKNVLVGYEVS